MPKMKSETHNKLRKYIKEFGNNIFQTDGKVLICKVCNKDVVFERKSQVQQHIKTETHQYKLKSYSNGEKQLFLSECDNSQVTKNLIFN